LPEVAQAAEGVTLCVQLAAAEKIPAQFANSTYRGAIAESAAGL
jgi:hypothetical protein